MAEKTEQATPKKLRDARKKGQVAKSQDFPSAFTFIVAICITLWTADTIRDQLISYLVALFKMVPLVNETSPINAHIRIQDQIGRILSEGTMTMLRASLPVAGIVALVGTLVNFLIIGPVFSTEVFKFDLKKLDPIKNLREKFKMKTLVELLKSILKIVLATVIIYFLAKTTLLDLIATAALPLQSTMAIIGDFLFRVALYVGIFYVAIGTFDLVYQKRQFAKEMKMEKFEVKQEYKDTEGNPEIKGKRRQIAQEIAYQSGPSNVRHAKAVVTNPTHLAIAIGYEPEKYPAPYIVYMGADNVAEQIIKEAQRWGVPIMRNVPLAHQLYTTGGINKYIPPETFEAVAEILRWVASLEGEEG